MAGASRTWQELTSTITAMLIVLERADRGAYPAAIQRALAEMGVRMQAASVADALGRAQRAGFVIPLGYLATGGRTSQVYGLTFLGEAEAAARREAIQLILCEPLAELEGDGVVGDADLLPLSEALSGPGATLTEIPPLAGWE